jgi:HK97 family phage major capsid protein
MKVADLQRKMATLHTEAQAIFDAADKENREMTSEEQTSFDSKLNEVGKLKAKIEQQSRLDQLENELDGVIPTQSKPDGNGLSLSVGQDRIKEDPNKGFKSPRHFLMEVMDAYKKPGKKLSDGLQVLRCAAGSDEQGSYSDPYGGFLVPEGFSPTLLTTPTEEDPTAGRTTAIPMESTVVNLPSRVDKNHTTSVSGGLTVSRSAETASKTASRMEMEKIRLEAFSLFGFAYATEEILTDSPISFAALIANSFGDEFRANALNERLNGSGAGEFLGVNKSDALIVVAKETNQTAKTINYKNCVKMRARCWRYGQAIWLANQDTLEQFMTMEDTEGHLIWQNNARDGESPTFLGRPIYFIENMETLGTQGDVGLYNFSQFIEGTYQPLQSAESIHVRFLNHERAYKFWLRNAGAPTWRAPLTPKKSASTLSPFVTLAARG